MDRAPKLGCASDLERAHVREERIEPYVRDVAIVERKLDAPRESRLRPRNAEIADRLPQKRQDLAAIAVRLHQLGARFEGLQQLLLVLPHPEEVVLLGD